MEDPLSFGLLLGGAVSLAGPWLSRLTVHEAEVFLPNLGINSSAAITSCPLPLTPLLILLVGLLDGELNRDATEALVVCTMVVVLIGWPLAFLSNRRRIAKCRAERQQNPEA